MPRTIGFALTMARRSIGRRKFRSALTILGIIIGISAVVSLMTLGYGMRSQVETSLNEMLGAGIVMNSSSYGIDIPEYVHYFASQVPGVNKSIPIIMSVVYIGNEPYTIVGMDPVQASEVYQLILEDGRSLMPGDNDAVVLDSTTASNLGVRVDDIVTFSTQTGGVGKTFRVVGILRPLIGFGQFVNIGCFITLDAAQAFFGKEGYVSSILIRLTDTSQGEQVESVLKQMFPDASIVRQEEIMRNISEIMNTVDGVLLGLASISLSVGALGIMNTIMMSVHERRREIGMLKAVGAERLHILFIFLSEALLISLIGGVLGCIFGLAGVYIIQWFVAVLGLNIVVPLLISPQILGLGMIAAIAVGSVAGFYPSWKAANVRPVEALRYE
ncbi:MAG: ABC transporter permease [Nitrososphaerales archaeon]|nr:ABC transporter permease [Nitrososphaerales archaeon]